MKYLEKRNLWDLGSDNRNHEVSIRLLQGSASLQHSSGYSPARLFMKRVTDLYDQLQQRGSGGDGRPASRLTGGGGKMYRVGLRAWPLLAQTLNGPRGRSSYDLLREETELGIGHCILLRMVGGMLEDMSWPQVLTCE